MALTRRQFLTLTGGSAGAAVLFAACGVPEDELRVQSSIRMPEDMVSGRDNWYATLCRECGTSEGVVVRVMEGRAKKIEGNVDYPVNVGKHSARCEASLQSLYNPDRIRGPLVRAGERGDGQFEEISWTDAIGRLTFHLQNLQTQRKQTSVVLATNPLGGHAGAVAQRFAEKFGGKYLTYEPVENTNLKRAIKTVFDQDRVPDFDLENTGFLLSFGADFLNTWGSPVRYGRGYGQFRQGDRERGTHFHVDSRFSMTGANADKWVPINPGMEGLLALSIAQVIIEEDLGDSGAADALTGGNPDAFSAFTPEDVSGRVGVSSEMIREIADEFAKKGSSLAIGGGSAGAHTNGLFNLVAIYSLNHLVGSVGQPGGVIFNPMPPLESIAASQAAGALTEWQEVVADMKAGRLSTLMVRGADPFYGLPASVDIRNASYDVPFIASFSDIMDDTTAMADLVLPQHSPLEDWGTDAPDFGPGYEVVGFQQPVVRPFFEDRGSELGTRGFADVLLTLAQGLNLDLELGGETFKEVLQADAQKLFALGRGSVNASSFAGFWNGVLQRGGWWDVNSKNTSPANVPPSLPDFEEPQFEGADRFQYHLTPFTQTGVGDGQRAHLPWMQATPDPITTATWRTWIEINLRLAEDLGIREGDVIKVSSPRGSIEALAYPHPGVPPSTVSIPFGQGHSAMGRYAKDRGANVFSILSTLTDTESGALAWAATKVNIEKMDEWVRVPKFENTVPELPRDDHNRVIEITEEDS